MTEKDPTGLAGAVAVIVMALAGIFDWQVDSDTASNIGTAAASLVSLAALFWARRHAWSPASVRALTPETVGAAGELPTISDPLE